MKKHRKKNSIILSALKLFSKKGFYNTTISEISKNMGISVGSIYNYFPSKKSLAKASIKFVTRKLASDLRYINDKDISQKEKIYQFVEEYFIFIRKHPEMIEYFFRVYLSNRELFCDEEDCGFSLAKEFIDEIERLVDEGVKKGEFKERNFYVAFSLVSGILGAMTFLSGENVLEEDLNIYCEDITNTIYKALSC
jgi:AcrR family transcriptional regulator